MSRKPLASSLIVNVNSGSSSGRERRRGRVPDGNDVTGRRARPLRKSYSATELSYSLRLLQPFVRTLREYPAVPAEVLATLSALEPDSRIPISTAHQTLDLAVELTADQDLGLKAARAFRVGEAGAVDYAVASAATGTEALEAAIRFAALVNDALEIRLEKKGSRVVVRLDNSVPLTRHGDDFQVGSLYAVFGTVWRSPIDAQLAVLIAHPAPEDITEYHRTFPGTRLVFGAAFNGFEFNESVLDAPLQHADANLHVLMLQHAERMLEELPPALPVTRRVKALIVEELANGNAGCSQVAERMQVSARTLERRLELEGTTFTRLLDEVRERLALRHVGSGELALAEVAALLGFSQTTAFHRAFRRWTGQTPLQYRRAQRGRSMR
jgi:AraC-like DNA-binding protein